MKEQNTEDRAKLASRVVIDPGTDVDRMTDEELLLEYRITGSSAMFEALVKRYERELYNYLRRFLNNQVLAEDAFQATFMQVHLKSHLFDSDRKVRPWLYTVATNQAIDIQRRNREASTEALQLAEQRYRVGSGTYIELLDARVEAERAASDYVAAVYEYHRSIAALENAVGRPLR